MDDLIKNAIEDLKKISREISGTSELPVNFPEDALALDNLLTNIMNQLDQIVKDLQKEQDEPQNNN